MSESENLSRKREKQLLKEKHRKHPEVSKSIIKEWEELRQKSISQERKLHLCDKIIKESKNLLVDLIKQKTTSRVYESVIEFGNEEHRWTIFEIIKNDIFNLCEGKYSAFFVISVLKYGTKSQKLHVYEIIKENVISLLQKTDSAKIVEYAYNDFANTSQRSELIKGFYGKKFQLFIRENLNELEEISTSNYGDAIIDDIHKNLKPILQKGLIDITIVQNILYKYLEFLIAKIKNNTGDNETNQTKLIVQNLNEVIDLVKEQVMTLCNTREGCKVAMHVYWNCNAKDRKIIMTNAKNVILNLCTNENSYLLVLAMLDQTDDVVQLHKLIIKPLFDNIIGIIDNKHGRKIVQFILNHRDKRFFNKFIISLLEKGDNNPYSKKDFDKRREEIVNIAKHDLLKWCLQNIDNSLQYSCFVNVVTSILVKCVPQSDEDKNVYNEILKSVSLYINELYVGDSSNKRKLDSATKNVPRKKQKFFTGSFKEEEVENEQEENQKIDCHLLESPAGQMLTRELYKLEKSGALSFGGFVKIALENIEIENLQSFISCNRTAFFLVNLYESADETNRNYLKEHLSILKKIKDPTLTGVQILQKYICEE